MSTCGYQTSKGPCKMKTGGGLCWRHSGGGSADIRSTGGKGGNRKMAKPKPKRETKKVPKPKGSAKSTGGSKSGWESASHEEILKVVKQDGSDTYTGIPAYTLYVDYGYNWFDFSESKIKALGVEPVFWVEKTKTGKTFHFKSNEKAILDFALDMIVEIYGNDDFLTDGVSVLGFKGLGPVSAKLKKVLKYSSKIASDRGEEADTRYFLNRGQLIKAVLMREEPEDVALYEFK